MVASLRSAYGAATTQTTQLSSWDCSDLPWCPAIGRNTKILIMEPDNIIFIDASPSKRKVQGSHSILSSLLPSWISVTDFCLESVGYFKILNRQIRDVLPISSIDEWAAVLLDETNREEENTQEELLISLVGFDCSMRELRQYKNANKDMASKLVTTMLQDLFPNDKDSRSIEYCIQQCPTLALFVSLPPSLASKKSKSIFNIRGQNPRTSLQSSTTLQKITFLRFCGWVPPLKHLLPRARM